MARPQKYHRQDVIYAARQLFWKKGYQATSITDLQKVTHLKPGSLYQAFGNKDGLLREVLTHYANSTLSCLDELQKNSPSILIMVKSFFDRQIGTACRDTVNGCLLVNSLLEFCGHNAELEEATRQQLSRIRNRFQQAIEDGKESGEFARSTDSDEKATVIMAAIWGIGVMGRMNPRKEHLQVFADTVAGSLEEKVH